MRERIAQKKHAVQQHAEEVKKMALTSPARKGPVEIQVKFSDLPNGPDHIDETSAPEQQKKAFSPDPAP